MQFDTEMKLVMLKDFQTFRDTIKNALYVKFSIPSENLFQYKDGDLIYLPNVKTTYMPKDREKLYMELYILNTYGYINIVRKPKKNELCYFWNGKDKMKATKNKTPFIAKFSEVIDKSSYTETQIAYSAKDCNFTFSSCEPVKNPYLSC